MQTTTHNDRTYYTSVGRHMVVGLCVYLCICVSVYLYVCSSDFSKVAKIQALANAVQAQRELNSLRFE